MWKFTRNMLDANPAALVSCQPAQSKCTWTCQKSHFVRKFTGNLPYALTTTPSSCEPAQSKCTLHFTRAILCENLQGKCQTLIPRRLSVRACAVQMHMDVSSEPYDARVYQKNGAPQDRDTCFVRACAVELHMDMSQEPFYVEIYKKHAGR